MKWNITAHFYLQSQYWKYKKKASAIYEQFYKTSHRTISPSITVFQTGNLTLNDPPLSLFYVLYISAHFLSFKLKTDKARYLILFPDKEIMSIIQSQQKQHVVQPLITFM